jgi:2-iminobutanoate/2-iminopropanoate deaminase
MTILRTETTPILHRIVEYNGIVYLAGFTADDTSASAKAQTENILAKIDKHLAMAGTDKSKLLTATIYVSDMSAKPQMNEAWTAWLKPELFPTRACVATGLDGGADVEIVVSAAK